MKLRSNNVYWSLLLLFILSSCSQQPKQEVKDTKQGTTYQVPSEMIKGEDGQLYFPENYHRPKSSSETQVKVYPNNSLNDSTHTINLN